MAVMGTTSVFRPDGGGSGDDHGRRSRRSNPRTSKMRTGGRRASKGSSGVKCGSVAAKRSGSGKFLLVGAVLAIQFVGAAAVSKAGSDIKVEFTMSEEAVVGSSIKLECEWQILGRSNLYSVKWYKDDHEFFRYLPDSNRRTQIFPRPGVKVETRPNSEQKWITLRDLALESSGQYKCEVSTEAPSFDTAYQTSNLTVIYVLLIVIIVILLMIFIFQIYKKEYYKRKRNVEFAMSLPGASIFSSFINSMQIACNYKELINYVEATTKKYGSFTRLILGTNVYVVLAKPEDYKLVLTNENGNDKSTVTKLWAALLGDGILRASGTTHRLRRKIIHPLLNIKHLSEYVTFFDNYSNHCADTLEKNVDGPMFDLKPYIARYSFNNFLVTTVGIQGTAHNGENDELLYWQQKLLKETYNRLTKPWLQLDWILPLSETVKQMCIGQKIMLNFINSISPQKIAERTVLQYNKEIFQKSKPIFDNYLNRLEQQCDNVASKSCEVSDENVLDDLKSFFFAIQNTITETTSFVMLMLGMHTEVQEKLRQEIADTFNNDKVDAQRLLTMRYFHIVFKETLRLFPISYFLSRQLLGDIKLESCTLPDGCYVMIPIFTVHRDPAYWYKPLEFIPERFLPENSSSRPHYTYIPFGTGLRDCLALPERGPEITGLSLQYAVGENVTANCSAWPSVPKANLRWTINGEPVPLENTVQHPPLTPVGTGGIPNSLGLRLEAEHRHFASDGRFRIKCIAKVGSREYKDERSVAKAFVNNQRLSAGDMHAAARSIRAGFLAPLLSAILTLVLLTT